MWFWCFLIVVSAVALVGAVSQQYFWWSMLGTAVLCAIGVGVELTVMYRQEQALGRQNGEQEKPPPAATAVVAASRAAAGPER